jgi:DNA-binding MarR family transcriptional regulator
MGAAGVKVYDKFSRVLRVETTVNDLSFFKHHRKVEHKDGHITRELATLKKTIYSLIDLREILLGCNQRYLAFLSSLDDPSAGERDLQRLSEPRVGTDPSVKGLNFFNATEQTLLRTLQRGEFNIHGWRRADLLMKLDITAAAMSRQLKRLRVLGLIKKVAHTYRYYLTRLGRSAIAAACSLTRFNIVPACAAAH